jgi:hypothetical protein
MSPSGAAVVEDTDLTRVGQISRNVLQDGVVPSGLDQDDVVSGIFGQSRGSRGRQRGPYARIAKLWVDAQMSFRRSPVITGRCARTRSALTTSRLNCVPSSECLTADRLEAPAHLDTLDRRRDPARSTMERTGMPRQGLPIHTGPTRSTLRTGRRCNYRSLHGRTAVVDHRRPSRARDQPPGCPVYERPWLCL